MIEDEKMTIFYIFENDHRSIWANVGKANLV